MTTNNKMKNILDYAEKCLLRLKEEIKENPLNLEKLKSKIINDEYKEIIAKKIIENWNETDPKKVSDKEIILKNNNGDWYFQQIPFVQNLLGAKVQFRGEMTTFDRNTNSKEYKTSASYYEILDSFYDKLKKRTLSHHEYLYFENTLKGEVISDVRGKRIKQEILRYQNKLNQLEEELK